MNKIKFISHDKQIQNWVRKFSKGTFQIQLSDNPQKALETLSVNHIDVILLDVGISMTIQDFIEGLQKRYLYIPVILVSGRKEKMEPLQAQFPEIMALLPKPFTQVAFQETIEDSLERYRGALKKEFAQGRSVGKLQESQFFVGFRTPATIYKVSKQGMVLFLPLAIADGTRILFKGRPLYQRMSIKSEESTRIELESLSCVATIDHRFKVTALFKSQPPPSVNEQLGRYINANAGKCSVLPPWNQTLLIMSEREDTVQQYRFYLKDAGFQLKFVSYGKEVIDWLQQKPVDMLILDTNTLPLHADFILHELQKVKVRVPLMVVSKEQTPEIVEKIAPFIKEFLVKPFNGETLKTRIHKAMERWESELKLQEEIGENVGIYFNTRIVLAYQDSAVIDKVRKDGLLFFKKLPIVPQAWIYFNATTLFRKMGLKRTNVAPLKLRIERCERIAEDEPYCLLAKFGDLFSFQLVVDAFVDNLPLPETEEITEGDIHEDDVLNDFFVGFDADFLVDELDALKS